MTCLSRLGLALLVAASAAISQDDENTRRSLKGLKGVWVGVSGLGAEADRDGLNKTAIWFLQQVKEAEK